MREWRERPKSSVKVKVTFQDLDDGEETEMSDLNSGAL